MISIYELFKAEIARQKKFYHLTNADIAKKAGIPVNTFNRFMSEDKSRNESDNVAKKVAAALKIEL